MAKESSKRCTHSSLREGGSVALKVMAKGGGGKIRKSRAGPWRATVLITLNLLMVAHIVQWLIMGRTVSPIEPSEFRFFLERGELNAGFVFFSLALLATFVLGRWVCGWGCHLVALQDLCGWMMKKVGVTPKPFRSRLLMFVPLIAGLYMFVWPSAARLIRPERYDPFPGFSNHLMTEGFWDTFGPVYMAIPFLFICGFATVYVLGAKGFCTYACPYGGFFALTDRLAVGRIRVTDACEQCGHCTAVCTSNVKVNQEVRDYGMVVDPGCMKCLDCVSVCPNDALYYGFGRPSLGAAARVASPARAAKSLSVGEELLAAGVFGFTMFAVRGLYDSVPFLMALGCAGVAAFVVLRLVELFRKPNVSIQNIRLKVGGKQRRSGGVFAALAGVVVLFLGHSAVIQYHAIRGEQLFERVQMPEELVLSGRVQSAELPEAFRSNAVASMRHLRFCEQWGLTGTYQANLNLAWLSLVLGQPERAISDLRRALTIDPHQAFPHYLLGRVHLATGRRGDAQREFRKAIEVEPHRLDSSLQLAKMLAFAGRMEEVVSVLRDVVTAHDGSVEAHHNLAFALRELGALPEAAEHYSRAVELAPDNPEVHFQLGQTYAEMERHEEAAKHLERAVQIDSRYRKIIADAVRP